jgi:glyoxalase family protein
MTDHADCPTTAGFYRDALGLRLVKRTVNFDAPDTYHLYYGNETGTPGTVLTFFPSADTQPGTPGRGQATATAFAVPEGSLDYWRARFDDRGVDHGETTERFGERVLPFADPDDQPLELVESDSDVAPWTDGGVPAEHAIRGFHGVTLHPTDPAPTGAVLEALGFDPVGEVDDRIRYVAGDRASVVDVRTADGPRGEPGTGTVHHVAFRARDDDHQAALADRAEATGAFVTPQKNRQYFRSVYFREPGGVLFEIATDDPGFTVDEDPAALGNGLQLPRWLEGDRETIERDLPDLDADTEVDA